ncbi:MAG TPA: DUF3048 domain-containing protein [Candidatus Limnocylindrales bacterium]|nr:DUF3048 domain-containing protein [Candidatus Limnocylindrales bacterium]
MTSRTPARGIATACLAVVVLAGCGSTTTPEPSRVIGDAASSPSPDVSVSPSPALSPSQSPDASPSPSAGPPTDPRIADLTGLATDPLRAHRLPIAVLIDDSIAARPQSGFNAASVVYQAPADGGEDRYMMVFQDGDTSSIGPVRSARLYFVQWASELRAGIAHYGGDLRARMALARDDTVRFTNIDALGAGGKAYHRISSRSAPHNGYTSTTALRAMLAKLGGPASVGPDLWWHPFVPPVAAATLPGPEHISIPYRTGRIDYRFDPRLDLYRRSVGGAAQVDPADGKAVTTRNVVVLFMSYKTDTKIEPHHSRPVIGNIGTGRALVFREGRLTQGTWSKADETAPTHLLDAAGREIPLVTGRTFFQIVPLGTKVGF